MVKITLNQDTGQIVASHGYILDPSECYLIDFDKEMGTTQPAIMQAAMIMGLPGIDDYHKWLDENGFSREEPHISNEFASKFYGKQALWETELSRGIVVKDEKHNDYFIIMECSRLCEGFKYAQIILAGCF